MSARGGYALLVALAVVFGAVPALLFEGADEAPAPRTVTGLRAELERRFFSEPSPIASSIYDSDGIVHLDLRADGESVARDLHRRYGERVRLTVGSRPFPPEGAAPSCPPLHSGTGRRDLSARVLVEEPPRHPGEDGRARVILRNDAPVPVDVDTGEPQVGSVLARGTARVVGRYTGFVAGVGRSATLPPGGEIALDVVFGTASCDVDLGYALPPGEYDLVAEVDVRDRDSQGLPTDARYIVSAPTRFELPS